MKKNSKAELTDWGRSEYKRSDLGKLVRGKYVKRLKESSNVVMIDPEVAEVFKTGEAVNEALRGLIAVKRASKKTVSRAKPKTPTPRKSHTA